MIKIFCDRCQQETTLENYAYKVVRMRALLQRTDLGLGAPTNPRLEFVLCENCAAQFDQFIQNRRVE